MNLISLLLIAGLVVGAYAGFVYMPLFLDNLEVRRSCQEALNSTGRFRDERSTLDNVLKRIHAIDTVEREIGGDIVTLPAIDPGDYIEVRLDESVRPAILFIDLSYERDVVLPLLGSPHVFYFSVYCETEL